MSLYDDVDTKQKPEQVAGWSSGIKLLQSQMQLRKAAQTQPRRDALRKSGVSLAPVIDLKSRRDDEDSNSNSSFGSYKEGKGSHLGNAAPRDAEWNFEGEYDPMWPNDYEKVVKDLREIREREKEREEEEKRRKNKEEREKRARERFESTDDRRKSGFAGRRDSDEEEEEEKEKPTTPRGSGVAIAPPPSLSETSTMADASKAAVSGEKYGLSFGGSVAAKIMAKYGFKEGQGLGKQEQGISMALQVEKTSKRGGRIISEKEIMPPPPGGTSIGSPGASSQQAVPAPQKQEPSITEIMKAPAKVVLLRNMVGPGEVDEDLEPEVKDECNGKYGDVVRVIIFEQPNVESDEAVRIFVEFKRIESAIKAVVDLNGRFFGGRQVKAGFYSWEKLNNLQLLD